MFRLDGVLLAGLLLDDVEHAADTERVGGEGDAAGGRGAAIASGLAREVGSINAAMVEEPGLNMFVDRHHAIDVLEEVKPRAVRDLVEGADRDPRVHLSGPGDDVGGQPVLPGAREDRQPLPGTESLPESGGQPVGELADAGRVPEGRPVVEQDVHRRAKS